MTQTCTKVCSSSDYVTCEVFGKSHHSTEVMQAKYYLGYMYGSQLSLLNYICNGESKLLHRNHLFTWFVAWGLGPTTSTDQQRIA